MAVLPQYQGQGVGKSLLASIKKIVPNYQSIIADTRKVNIKACNFYKRNGFISLNTPHDDTLIDSDKYCGLSLENVALL